MALIVGEDDAGRLLAIVRRGELDSVWPIALPFMEQALTRDYGEQTISDVYRNLWNGEAELWILYEDDGCVIACGVVQVVEYDTLRACRIVLMAGDDMPGWMTFVQPIVEEWALDHGCTRIESNCRPGFARRLKPLGYTAPYVMVTKDLTAMRH